MHINEQLLRIKTVIEITGLSRSGIYRAIQRGEFPESIRISQRSVAWPASSIEAWLERVKASHKP